MEATKPGSGKTETVKTQEIEEKPATPHGSETSSSLPKAKPVDPELTVSKEVLLTNMRLLNANGYPFTDMLTQGEHKLGLELLQAAINVAEQPMSQKSRIRKLADLATFVDGYLSHYPYFTGSKQKIFAQEMKRIATLLQTVLSEKVQDYDKSPVSTSLSADDGSSLLKLAVHVLTQDRSENLAGIRMELALKAHDFCCRFEKTADSTDESESRSTTTTMLRVLMLGMVNTFKSERLCTPQVRKYLNDKAECWLRGYVQTEEIIYITNEYCLKEVSRLAEGGQLPEDLSLELKLVVIFTRAIFIYANEEVYQEIVGLPMLQRSGISTDQSSYQSWLTNHETQAQGLIDCLKEDELSPEQEATIFVAQVHFLIFRKKFQQAVTALESAARLGSLYALHTLLDLHLTKLPDPAVGVNAWLNYKKPCESNLCRTRFEQHYDIGRKEPHELKALKYHKLALGMFETVRSGDCSIEKIHALTQPDVILGDKEPQILYSIRNLDNVYLFRGIAFMLAGKRQEAMETLNCIADHPCGRYLYAWLLNAEGSPLEDKKKAYTIFKELADTKYQAASQLQTAQCYMKELNFVEAKRYLSLAMAKFREKESYERLQVCQSLWAYLPDWVKQTHIEVPRLPEDQSAQRKQHPKSKIKKKLQQELQAVEISSPSAAKAPFPKDSVTSGRLSDDDSDGHVSDELDFVDDSEQLPEFLGLRNASSESPSVVTPTALVTRASVVSPSARPRAETTFSKEVHRDICAMIKRFEFDEAEQTLDTIDFNQESVINKAWHMQLRAWLIRCRWDQNEYGSEHAAKPRARKQQQIQFLEGALDHLKQGLKLFNIISVEALEKGFVDTNRLIADIGSDSDRHMVFILLSERARIHKCLDGLYVHNRQHKKYCDNLWKIAFAVSGTVRGHATAPRKQQPKISIISKEEFEYQKQSMQ